MPQAAQLSSFLILELFERLEVLEEAREFNAKLPFRLNLRLARSTMARQHFHSISWQIMN